MSTNAQNPTYINASKFATTPLEGNGFVARLTVCYLRTERKDSVKCISPSITGHVSSHPLAFIVNVERAFS